MSAWQKYHKRGSPTTDQKIFTTMRKGNLYIKKCKSSRKIKRGNAKV